MKSLFAHYYLSFHSLGLIWGLAGSQKLKNRRFTNTAISRMLIRSTDHGLSGIPSLAFAVSGPIRRSALEGEEVLKAFLAQRISFKEIFGSGKPI